MQGILYLIRKTFKNRIKELKTHPGKLVGYLIFVGLMVMCFVSANMSSEADSLKTVRSIEELGAIILGLFMFIFLSEIYKGISSGGTLFKMADVNLLFVSPVSPKKILIYGLVNQLGQSILISVFILFQAATLKSFYGVETLGLFIIFIGYFIVAFTSNIVSMAIYSITSGSTKKKNFVKLLMYILTAPVAISILRSFSVEGIGNGFEGVVKAINSSVNEWIPVAGWIKGIIYEALTGDSSKISIYVILTIIGVIGVIIAILRNDNNYYEDVLGATEAMQTRIQDAKEGRIAELGFSKKAKVKKYGINKGNGSSVFLYKHMIENKRAGKFIIDLTTVIQVVVVSVFALALSKEVDSILPTIIMSVYMQLFMSFNGRWAKELSKHYIYMIPDSSFKKLLWVSCEGIIKCLIDGVILFVIVGAILKASIVEIALCIIIRVTYGVLFIAGDVIATRIFGRVSSKGVLSILTFIFMIIVALPGIIVAGIVSFSVDGNVLCILIAGIWNVIISVIMLFFSRNILDNIEQNI